MITPRFILISILFFYSCTGGNQFKRTPEKFRNHSVIAKNIYRKDSLFLISDFYKKMKNHYGSFSNAEYYDSTIVIIDSILYDSTFNKIAVFLIAKNPTHRNMHLDSKEPYYYNASCYLGSRVNADSSAFELKQLGPFSLSNFDNIVDIKEAIRESYFLELSTVLDVDDTPFFDYNLDDKRFWTSEKGWEGINWTSETQR
jgi:hypothetical protein